MDSAHNIIVTIIHFVMESVNNAPVIYIPATSHLGVEHAVIRSPAAHPASICFNSISLWGIRTFSSKRASNLLTHKKIDTKTCRYLLYVMET